MQDTEVAETLMSLSAPDERQYASPLYAEGGLPWHADAHAYAHAHDKMEAASFQSFSRAAAGETLANSLPNASVLFGAEDAERMEDVVALSLLQHGADIHMHARPLTDMIPDVARTRSHHPRQDDEFDDDDNDDDSDVDMDVDSDDNRHGFRYQYSPFDGLVAAADHEATTKSQPISIPSRAAPDAAQASAARRMEQMKTHKWSLSRVKEDASGIGRDNSPTGVEDDSAWFEQYRQTNEYKQRARLASICSSEGSTSDYGGLGRKHLEEFIRMEISATNETGSTSSPPRSEGSGKCIGSYSPDARRRRIERFLEKRKHRVWAKKVDYDVRKNFANSRLRVKGRFVKKEDEELLCELLSFT